MFTNTFHLNNNYVLEQMYISLQLNLLQQPFTFEVCRHITYASSCVCVTRAHADTKAYSIMAGNCYASILLCVSLTTTHNTFLRSGNVHNYDTTLHSITLQENVKDKNTPYDKINMM